MSVGTNEATVTHHSERLSDPLLTGRRLPPERD
jgi:hypothetical protein